MYAISNRQKDDIIKLLSEVKAPKGCGDKTLNNKRRANIIIKKLAKAKQVSYKQIK